MDRLYKEHNKMFLRIYSIIYLLMYLMMYVNTSIYGFFGWAEWVEFGISMISVVGLLSYAFKIKILFRSFWTWFLYIFIIFELVYMPWLQEPLLEKADMVELGQLDSLLNAILEFPAAYAIYKLQQKPEILSN